MRAAVQRGRPGADVLGGGVVARAVVHEGRGVGVVERGVVERAHADERLTYGERERGAGVRRVAVLDEQPHASARADERERVGA